MQPPKQAVTKATALRHLRMIKALQFMAAEGTSTAIDISAHVEQSLSWGRIAMRVFVDHELVSLSHYEASGARGRGSPAYRLLSGAMLAAEDLLPIGWDGKEVTGDDLNPLRRVHTVNGTFQPRQVPVFKVHRDPLVACIHGYGRAPSLNFRDSTQGDYHAESKATDGAH